MRDDTESILARVRERWVAEGATPASPAGVAEMAGFEERYGVRLPAEVRAYFGALNGMAEGWDAELVAWWPLGRVRTVAEEMAGHGSPMPAASEHFCFADYSVWALAYAVRLTADPDQPAPVVVVRGMNDHVPAAPSFRDFLAAYLNDPYAALHPRSST